MTTKVCCSCNTEVIEWYMEQTKFGPVCPSCMGEYEEYCCRVEDERKIKELIDE